MTTNDNPTFLQGGSTSTPDSDLSIPTILAGMITPHAVCTLFILCRVYARVVLLRKWYLDDTLIVAAWFFSSAVCIPYSVAAQTAGQPGATEQIAIEPYVLRTYIGLIFYQLCLCLTKLSIVAFYLRMFKKRTWERRVAWVTVVWILLYGTPLLAMSIFQCHPRPGQFFGTEMYCFSFTPLLITSASLHSFTDAWLIVMIVPCVVRLELPVRQKIALAGVLSLSIFVIAASMIRLQLSLRQELKPMSEQVFSTLAFFVMTVLECDIALICASAPMLRPIISRLAPKVLGESQQGSRASSSSVNLTSVSFHGYPWQRVGGGSGAAQSRSKNASRATNLGMSQAHSPANGPKEPAPIHRSPTSRSIRSMVFSSVGSRGAAAAAARGLHQTNSNDSQHRPILREKSADWDAERASAGFDSYYDVISNYGDDPSSRPSTAGTFRRTAGGVSSSSLLRLKTPTAGAPRSLFATPTSPIAEESSRWTGSQESFVMGENDPASPTKLTSPYRFSDRGSSVRSGGIDQISGAPSRSSAPAGSSTLNQSSATIDRASVAPKRASWIVMLERERDLESGSEYSGR